MINLETLILLSLILQWPCRTLNCLCHYVVVPVRSYSCPFFSNIYQQRNKHYFSHLHNLTAKTREEHWYLWCICCKNVNCLIINVWIYFTLKWIIVSTTFSLGCTYVTFLITCYLCRWWQWTWGNSWKWWLVHADCVTQRAVRSCMENKICKYNFLNVQITIITVKLYNFPLRKLA